MYLTNDDQPPWNKLCIQRKCLLLFMISTCAIFVYQLNHIKYTPRWINVATFNSSSWHNGNWYIASVSWYWIKLSHKQIWQLMNKHQWNSNQQKIHRILAPCFNRSSATMVLAMQSKSTVPVHGFPAMPSGGTVMAELGLCAHAWQELETLRSYQQLPWLSGQVTDLPRGRSWVRPRDPAGGVILNILLNIPH